MRWCSNNMKCPVFCVSSGSRSSIAVFLLFAFFFITWLLPGGHARAKGLAYCDYFKAIKKLYDHPECADEEETTEKPLSSEEEALPLCATVVEGHFATHATLVQCVADPEECPGSGQLCTQTDGTKCCAEDLQDAKPGNCPKPVGISIPGDGISGCWLDANCPSIQKCCLEPNPVTGFRGARRVCRDPVGINGDTICHLPIAVGHCTAFSTRFYFDPSTGKCKNFQYSGCGGNANNFQSQHSCQVTCGLLGVQGTPTCPVDANAELNCALPHPDACHTDADCLGRENAVQPSCCMTKCGYRICYVF